MNPKQIRRWYQFSLKTLLVTFTLLTMMLGALTAFTAKGRRQKAVVERVQGLGGKIVYIGYEWDPFGPYKLNVPPPPGMRLPDQSYYARQVRKWLGRDYVDPVVGVGLTGDEITDDDLAQLASLTELETLSLFNTGVSDVGLVHVKKLSHLKYLNLSYTAVTDEGMAEIQKALPNCRIKNSP
jgi:hypothetical protein